MKTSLHLIAVVAVQGISEEEALKERMEEKSREFSEKGNEIYFRA